MKKGVLSNFAKSHISSDRVRSGYEISKHLDHLSLFFTTELTCQVANSHLENAIYFEFWLTVYITMIRNYIHVPRRAPTIELTLVG